MAKSVLSILDTDLYKFSMSYSYLTLYPLAEGVFEFNDRNRESWSDCPEFLENIKMELAALSSLKLTEEEKKWCTEHIPYIPASYWEWLSTFRFEYEKFEPYLDGDGVFHCRACDRMYKVTLYEIPMILVFCKVRNDMLRKKGMVVDIGTAQRIIEEKVEFANRNNVPFSEFGTRRRYDSNMQEMVDKVIKERSHTCTGNSNVYFCMRYDMVPQGTVAHENIMFHAAVFGYKRANYLTIEDWIKVYDGSLGTALIDTYTTPSFLRTLTRKQAHLLSGFRQDSGDEYKVGNMVIKRLKEFGIDPRSKVIVFSNALDMDKARDIYDYFNGRCKVAFGIGTNLTCDPGIEGYRPANAVAKLVSCRLSDKDPWEKCIKISDDVGKHMGDDYEFEIAKYELHLED